VTGRQLTSAVVATGHIQQDVSDLVISHSAIRRARMNHSEVFTSEVKATFAPSVSLILHWDGKLIEELSGPGREKVDRLAVLVSGQDVIKLLSVPKLNDGKAVTMSNAIMNSVDEWGLRHRIKGLCFDTTASNTVAKGVACIFWSRKLDESCYT